MNKLATVMGASAIGTSYKGQTDEQLGLCLSNKAYYISPLKSINLASYAK